MYTQSIHDLIARKRGGGGTFMEYHGVSLKCIQCFFIHALDFLKKVVIIVKHIEQTGIFRIRNHIYSFME